MKNTNRHRLEWALLHGSLVWFLSAVIVYGQPDDARKIFTGPMVGHVDDTTGMIWFRPGEREGLFELKVHEAASGKLMHQASGKSDANDDYCIKWQVTGLQPSSEYRYSIFHNDEVVLDDEALRFRTAPASGAPAKIRLAIGSCADMKPIKLWSDIEEAQVDGLVWLGDTPYIDSTDLSFARQRHREFLSIEPLARLIRHTPSWGTWDDHDFGGNDTSGLLKGKINTRRAFVEYRANAQFGHEDQGIYSKFSYGPVDVWLLDTRWFSRTEPSPVDPAQPTLLGQHQWQWLQDTLRASKAPYKLITCGMIWDDKENKESDDWGTYTYERQALFDFIGQQKISGVLLVGGDIHCSRLLKYKTESTCGYPIYQLIVSPFHERVIPSLNVAHPDLIHGSATPNVWLKLDVDSTATDATLRAEWVQMQGQKMWNLELKASDLNRQ